MSDHDPVRAKGLLAAHIPFKMHLHRVISELVQPGPLSCWRHPFLRDLRRFVDGAPRR